MKNPKFFLTTLFAAAAMSATAHAAVLSGTADGVGVVNYGSSELKLNDKEYSTTVIENYNSVGTLDIGGGHTVKLEKNAWSVFNIGDTANLTGDGVLNIHRVNTGGWCTLTKITKETLFEGTLKLSTAENSANHVMNLSASAGKMNLELANANIAVRITDSVSLGGLTGVAETKIVSTVALPDTTDNYGNGGYFSADNDAIVRTLTLAGEGSYSFAGQLGSAKNQTSLNLVKSGTGTQILSGLSYFNLLEVDAGTLILGGSVSVLDKIEVASGATLSFASGASLTAPDFSPSSETGDFTQSGIVSTTKVYTLISGEGTVAGLTKDMISVSGLTFDSLSDDMKSGTVSATIYNVALGDEKTVEDVKAAGTADYVNVLGTLSGFGVDKDDNYDYGISSVKGAGTVLVNNPNFQYWNKNFLSEFTGTLEIKGTSEKSGVMFLGNVGSSNLANITSLKLSEYGTLSGWGGAFSRPVELAGGTLVSESAFNFTGGVSLSADSFIEPTGNSSLTISSKISGGNVLTKKGTGTLFITGNSNDFSGVLLVEAGKVYVGANDTGGSGSDANLTSSAHGAKIIVEFGGAFVTHLGGSDKTFDGDIYLKNGATLGNCDGHVTLTGDIHWGVTNTGTDVSSPTYSVDSVVNYTQVWQKNITFAGKLYGNGIVNLGQSSWEASASYIISGEDNDFSGLYNLNAEGTVWGNARHTSLILKTATAARSAKVNLETSQTSLKLGVGAITIAGLSGSGSVVLDSVTSSMLTVNGGGDFAGTIATGIALVKSGADTTLTLSGDNSANASGVKIVAGTLVAGNANALGSGSVTLSGGLLEVDVGTDSTLTFNNTLKLISPSAETAAVSLKSGALTFGANFLLDLGGTAETPDGITVKLLDYNGGNLSIDSSVNLHDFIAYNGIKLSSRVTVDDSKFATDGTLSLSGGAYNLYWSGGETGTWDYTTSGSWKKDSLTGTEETFVAGDNAIFDAGAETALAVTIGSEGVNAGLVSLNSGALTLSGGKLTASRVEINDGATLKLGGPDVVSGNIEVESGGVLDFNGFSGNFGANGGTITLSGGTLTNNGATVSHGEQQLYGLSLAKDSFIGGTGDFGIVCAGNKANQLDLGGFTLTKSGANTFFLSNTTLVNGTLKVEEGTLSGTVSGPNTKLGQGAHIETSGSGVANLTITSMADGATLVLGGSGASSVTLSGDQVIRGSITVGENSTVSMGNGDVLSYDSLIKQKIVLNGGTLSFGSTRQTINSGTTIEFNGGSLTGSGDAHGALDFLSNQNISVSADTNFEAALRLRGNATFDVAKDVTLNLSGVIDPKGDDSKGTAGGALVKSGAGTMVLSGSNTSYENGVTVSAGTLVAAGANALGTGNVSIASGATLEFRNADFDSEIKSAISGDGSVVKSGTGTLTLSAESSYTGGTKISAGTLVAANAKALGVGDVELATGTTLETLAGTIGSGKITIAGSGVTLKGSSALTADGLAFVFTKDSGSVALENLTFTNVTVDLSALTIEKSFTIFTGYGDKQGISVTGVAADSGRLIFRSSGNVIWRVGNELDLYWSNGSGNSVWDYTSQNWTGDDDYYTNGNSLIFNLADAVIKINGTDFSANSAIIEENTTFEQYGDNAYAVAIGDLDILAEKTLKLSGRGKLSIGGSLNARGVLSVGKDAIIALADTVKSVSGTLSGDGRVELASSSTSVGETFKAKDWTGTVALVNAVSQSGFTLSAYGNANSTIELAGFTGHFAEAQGTQTIASNLVLNGDVAITNGWSGGHLTFAGKVSGPGSFSYNHTYATQTFTFSKEVDLASVSLNRGTMNFSGAKTTIGTLSQTGGTLNISGNANSNVAITSLTSSGALNISGVSLTLTGTNTLSGTTTLSGGAVLDLTESYFANGGNGKLVVDNAKVKMSNMAWGASGNFGADMHNDRLQLKNGGVLEITAAQNAEAGALRGFSVVEGTGTYLYSGDGKNYISHNTASDAGEQYIALATGTTLCVDVEKSTASVEFSKIIAHSDGVAVETDAKIEKNGAGTLTLSGANLYSGGTTIAAGTLKVENASALGAGAVANNAALELAFDGSFGNAVSGTGSVSVNTTGTITLSGANTYSGGTTISAGALKVENASALGSGTVANNAALELAFADGEMSNVISGTGSVSVNTTGTITLSGANTYSGGTTISAGTLKVENASALGSGDVSLNQKSVLDLDFSGSLNYKLSGNGKLSVAKERTIKAGKTNVEGFTGNIELSGTLNFEVAEDYALDSVISGEGTLKKSGAGKVTLAAGTNVADIDLAGGMLKDVKIGNNGVSNLKVSAAGTTLEALTTEGGILDVSEQSVILSGNVNLSGGTIVLGKKDSASLIVAGTTTITGATIFNLRDFVATDYPTHTNPNTLGETASVVYQVFDVTTNTGATLNGWENLDKGNFTIGSGAALSDRAHISLDKANGSLTLTNEIYSLTWKGDSGTWTVGNGESWTNDNANKASDTVYMNSDRVTFAGDAAVALGSNVAPTSLSVKSGADLTIEASDSYKITGTGTVSVGENASLTFNSAHDYTGTTTLANGATVRLNLAAGDAAQFTSNLVLASGATGTLLVDTTKLGAAGLSDLDKTFTGTFGEGAWSFEKLGEGSLAVSSKMSAFTVEDSVNIAAGTLKLMAVDAIGFAKTTVADGATLEVAVAKDAALALAFSGNGNFRKSGGGTLTLANSNAMFGGNAVVAEGTLLLADAGALGDSRKSTSLEVLRNAQADLAFGGSFGKELKGEGRVNYVAADRLVLTADSKEFVGTFALTADNAVATARQATSFGNGNIAFGGKNGALAFVLTPASGQTVADVFAGSFSGEGTISVETGLGIAMTLSGSSADFEGAFELKAGSKLIAEKGDALGNEKASVVLGKDAELFVGSAENSSLAAVISGDGSLTKLGAGTVDVSNKNDFTGTVTVKDGLLRATSLAALGKSSQVLLDSAGATLELKTSAGKTETFNKVIRGSGNLSLGGGGVLNWENAEKRFAGVLKVSEKTTLNTSEFFKVESGSVVLDNGAVWNANGGLSVKGNSTVALFAAEAVSATYGIRSRASQTLAAGTQLSVGGFVASANKSGSVVFNNIVIMPTNGGNGASVSFEVTSEKDAETPRITLTNDASVSLNNVAIEVVLDESISSAWDVPEIEFVYRDGTAADVSGEVESVTVVMANGTEVKYVYDSRAGSLSLSPVSPDMNLAYAAMVAMPTELFNQDAQSLHRRMEQRRFETASNKDEWQFFAQAQSMSVENGSDRADSAVFDFSTYGALVGGDVRLSESTVFGMALAYDRGTATIHDSQGEIDADSYRATIYAGTVFNDYYFAEGGAHFGFSSYEIERQGDYGNNKGDVDGWSAGLFATAGGLIPTAIESFYLTPYVGVSYLHSAVEKIEETGTRSMTTDDFSADSLRSRVGIGASYAFAIGETPTRFGLDVAYSHEFLDDEVDADVVATGVAYSRTITEKALPEDVVSVGASFDFSLSENTGLFLNYTADFGMNSDISHRGNVGFRFTY